TARAVPNRRARREKASPPPAAGPVAPPIGLLPRAEKRRRRLEQRQQPDEQRRRSGAMVKMAAAGGGGGGGRYYGGGSEGGRAPKRLKTDNAGDQHGGGGGGGGAGAAGGGENYDDPHKTPASPVVHIRGLIDGVVEADLVEALQEFGPISYVVVMPKKRQALVEFEDVLGACNAVNYAADNQIYIAGHPAFVNYSTSQKISRPGDSDDSRSVNSVLLFTILNPIYSITTDVLYTICNPCGPVQRIVIFRKNGVQAMVEYPLLGNAQSLSLGTMIGSSLMLLTFDSVQSAQRAKASLNGADIYSGCCTLKIEYAKPTRLNVFKNDQDTWDYTNPNLSGQGDPGSNPNKRQRQPPLLGDHPAEYGGPHGAYHSHYHDEGYGPPPPHYEGRRMGPPVGGHRRGPSRYGPQYGHPPPPPPPPEYGPHADSPVLMVYGLDQSKMNCDRVFNVFCLYGNVEKVSCCGAATVLGKLGGADLAVPVHAAGQESGNLAGSQRVKFMKSKPGAAMVEMADGYAVDRAITHLNNNFMFGQKLNVCVSKQPAIMPGPSYGLEDGSCSYKDFSESRNNRFSTPEQAAKNRIQHPSNVLHFFNAPLEVTEENFFEICDELGVKRPSSVKVFSGKSERSSSGLLEWESKSDALETLGFLNHYQMKNPSEYLSCSHPRGLTGRLASGQHRPARHEVGPRRWPSCQQQAGLTPRSRLALSVGLRAMGTAAQGEASTAASSEAPGHNYESLRVTSAQKHILHVQINRPEKRNAMNRAFWREMVECFNKIAEDPDCRVVVMSGGGKMFTAGIDLMDMASDILQPEGDDVSRISWNLRRLIAKYQETFSVIEKCPKPVIAAIHGGCIGGGVDLITACDIRYCAQDAFFQVKEVDVGLAADVGTLQRLPRVIGNQSLVNELAFTARKMMADEALECGLVSRVFPDKEVMLDAAFDLAAQISSKSPVAVQGTKVNLVYSRDHSVAEGLSHMATWNMSMLQTSDLVKSVQAAMEKKDLKSVAFSKL
ncbi:Heterogeneous nuclear ribonucleoprotein L, partial [Galemys pyrenaicus]